MDSEVAGVDLERLGCWMDTQRCPTGPIEHGKMLAGGSQNILFLFERAGERYVLRRPPIRKRKESDEAMRRESRVLSAIAGSGIPHPRLIASCDDESIIGAAFYLMEPVDGFNPTLGLPGHYADDSAWRRQLGSAMVEAAAAIGAIDYRDIGLDGLGKPTGYLERQVSRWRAQLESYSELPGYKGPELPGFELVAEWLEVNRPRSWSPGLIHGDFHLANVLCAYDRPEVLAVVDWELATIGDPLLDLGWLSATWPVGEHDTVIMPLKPSDGLPTRDELIAEYAERSDRDLGAVAWYEVLACYKLGIILEGTYARSSAGLASREVGDQLHRNALALFLRATRRLAKA